MNVKKCKFISVFKQKIYLQHLNIAQVGISVFCMLKINPIITGKSYDLKGVQVRTPDIFVSKPVMKPTLKTDIFERQEKRENISAISFLGNKIQNKYVSGETIANNMKNVLKSHVGGVSSKQFQSEYNKIDEKFEVAV